MRMRWIHLEAGNPGEDAHSRPTKRTLLEVEMGDEDDVMKMATMRVQWKMV